MPQCMPDQYKVPDSIQAYHNYYINDKQPFAVWTDRSIPEWYAKEWNNRNHKQIATTVNSRVKYKMIPL